MPYCTGCGKEIAPSAAMCGACGRAVQTAGNAGMHTFAPPAIHGPQAVPVYYATTAPPLPAYLVSGNDPEALPLLNGWNWGGFFLSWMWCLAHERISTGVLILVLGIIPGLGTLVRWGFKIYLGVKGNELAWSSRRFRDINEFNDIQRAWTVWGIVIFVISIIILVGFIGMTFLAPFFKV
jgi:hypothetical protein